MPTNRVPHPYAFFAERRTQNPQPAAGAGGWPTFTFFVKVGKTDGWSTLHDGFNNLKRLSTSYGCGFAFGSGFLSSFLSFC